MYGILNIKINKPTIIDEKIINLFCFNFACFLKSKSKLICLVLFNLWVERTTSFWALEVLSWNELLIEFVIAIIKKTHFY